MKIRVSAVAFATSVGRTSDSIRELPGPPRARRAKRREILEQPSARVVDAVAGLAEHEIGPTVAVHIGKRRGIAHQIFSVRAHLHPQRCSADAAAAAEPDLHEPRSP